MQYFGGKSRISNKIAEFLNGQLLEGQSFVDMFCGSCNIVSKINPDRQRYANDRHRYLISLFKGLQEGWKCPPRITKEDYIRIKDNKDEDPALSGFVGFGMSFSGKWFGGFTGEISKNSQDYLKCATNGLNVKMKGLVDVKFSNEDYSDFKVPKSSLIYCDIPYKGTTPYCKNEVGIFEHNKFYDWCNNMTLEGHKIYVSEYKHNVPDGAIVVLEVESGKTNAAWMGYAKKTTEVVYTWNL